jgi:hypothetical protein
MASNIKTLHPGSMNGFHIVRADISIPVDGIVDALKLRGTLLGLLNSEGFHYVPFSGSHFRDGVTVSYESCPGREIIDSHELFPLRYSTGKVLVVSVIADSPKPETDMLVERIKETLEVDARKEKRAQEIAMLVALCELRS